MGVKWTHTDYDDLMRMGALGEIFHSFIGHAHG